jgi:hypothetical protein
MNAHGRPAVGLASSPCLPCQLRIIIPARGAERCTFARTDADAVADKLTPLILDALARAVAEPTGQPLHAAKADPGLFPASAAAKPAAQKCLQEGLIHVVRTDVKGKQARDLYAATDRGLKFLIDHGSPKQVLEDFVRVLEERHAEVGELLAAAGRMAAGIEGIRAAVAAVLPRVEVDRFAPLSPGGEGGESCLNPSPPPNSASGCSPCWATGRRRPGCRRTARCRSCSAP